MGAELKLLAVNLTRRCNLRCAHCYLDAGTLQNGSADELASAEVCHLLDEVAGRAEGTLVVLTGGEPLLRRDLEQIAAHGAGLGLAMVVGTNGMLLTDRRVQSLKAAGVMGCGISVDSLEPRYHDSFRGVAGAWAKTISGIENCRRHRLSFQIHFTVTEQNARELPAMIDFARRNGARVLNVFFLVCTGRGQSLSDITPQQYEKVLEELIDAQEKTSDLIIRARCAPHFKRIAYRRNPASALNRISGRDGDGCIAGTHYCRVTFSGGVTACPYIAHEEGNIRERKFGEIWDHAAGFQRLRTPVLGGACGACEYRELCGGCRARALALSGGIMEADPWCAYVPRGDPVIQPLSPRAPGGIAWSEEAEQRLSRVPAFLRNMVRQRTEAYVAERGEHQVTVAHLAELTARRFGAKPPALEGAGDSHRHGS